jgi:hypothetical protein
MYFGDLLGKRHALMAKTMRNRGRMRASESDMIPSEIAKREELCMTVTIRFVGSGDSFGSGGRFQKEYAEDGMVIEL